MVAGSVAATAHAGIGIAQAGTIFSTLQSLGAMGLGIFGTMAAPVILTTGAVTVEDIYSSNVVTF